MVAKPGSPAAPVLAAAAACHFAGAWHQLEHVEQLPPPKQQQAWRQHSAVQQQQQQHLQWQRDAKLFVLVAALHACVQVAELVVWQRMPPVERAQHLLSLGMMATPLLLCAAAPSFYLRHRHKVVAAFRLMFCSLPLLHAPRGIQRVLDSVPQPGVRGTILDLLKLTWGSRLTSIFMAGIVAPLPLLLHMAVSMFEMMSVRSNPALCASPLLTHPLTAACIRRAHGAMQALSQPFGTTALTSAALQGGGCEAFFSFWAMLVGPVLGTVLVVKTRVLIDSERSWHGSGGGGVLARAAGRVTEQLERAAGLLCGGSWFVPPAKLLDAQDEEGQQRLLQQVHRVLAWAFLLSYLHALAAAIS